MKKNEVNYSLWLRPIQSQIDELTKIMSDLSHQYRTKPFPPHITLLSNIPVELNTIKQACTKIVDQTQEFDIPLQNIAYSETYYRNFYIQAELTPALTDVYESTKKLLNYTPDEDYLPHVSLLYGKLSIETKEKLNLQLDKNYPKKLICNRLDLYSSSGNVSDWHLIETYSFATTKK